MPFRCLPPLDQAKSRTMAAFKLHLYSGNAERVDAGTGVVVAPVGLMLDLHAVCLDLGFEVAALRQRQILEDRPMGMAGKGGSSRQGKRLEKPIGFPIFAQYPPKYTQLADIQLVAQKRRKLS